MHHSRRLFRTNTSTGLVLKFQSYTEKRTSEERSSKKAEIRSVAEFEPGTHVFVELPFKPWIATKSMILFLSPVLGCCKVRRPDLTSAILGPGEARFNKRSVPGPVGVKCQRDLDKYSSYPKLELERGLLSG